MFNDPMLLLFLIGPSVAAELVLLVVLFRMSRRRPEKAGRGKIVLINVLSCFVLLLFAGLGGEVYFRYVYDTTDSLAYTKVSKQWLKRYCRYNTAGYRDNVDYLTRLVANTRRVSFVGDSFTAGHGIKSVEDRFPNLIRARHADWDVQILAQFGYDTGRESTMLVDLRKKGYQFDQVVLVYCLNDVSELFPDWQESLRKLLTEADHPGWLRGHSFFIDTLYHRYRAARDPQISQYYSFVREAYRGSLWETQKSQLKAMRDFVEANGGHFSVVTFPFLQVEGPDYEYQSVHQQLDQFWKELGVPHLDLHPVFAGEKPAKITVNRYDAHPNEYAHALAARKIDEFVAEQVAKSPRASAPK